MAPNTPPAAGVGVAPNIPGDAASAPPGNALPGVCTIPPIAAPGAGSAIAPPGSPAGGPEANPGRSAIALSRVYSASAASASANGSRWSFRRRNSARCSAFALRTFSCSRAKSPPTLLKYRCARSTAARNSAGPALLFRSLVKESKRSEDKFSSPPFEALTRFPPRSAVESASKPGPHPPWPCTLPVVRRFLSISSVPRSKPSAAAYSLSTDPFKNSDGRFGRGRYTGVASGGGGVPGCVLWCADAT